MGAEETAAFVLVFTSLLLLALCQDPTTVTAKRGGEAILHCESPKYRTIEIIQWSRADLKTQEYVFLYHSNKPHKSYQLSSYHDRVTLNDTTMENGDASIVLKNVMDTDRGIYHCFVLGTGTGRSRRNEPQLTNIINLQVKDSDYTAGGRGGGEGGEKADGGGMREQKGLLVGLISCGGAVAGLLGFAVRNKFMRKNSKQLAAVETGEQNLQENLNSKEDKCASLNEM